MAEWGNNSAHKYKNRLAIRHSVCYNDNRKRDTVIRRRSSAGQSARFTSVRSWVRAPSSPPKTKRAPRALFIFAGCTLCDVPHRRRRLRFAPGWHRISLRHWIILLYPVLSIAPQTILCSNTVYSTPMSAPHAELSQPAYCPLVRLLSSNHRQEDG